MPPRGSITRPPAEIYGQHLGYGFAGLCVNTAIGNFSRTIADLTFPGNLLGLLDWTRTYNSLSGTAGALGPGWTTAFSARLQVSEQGLLHHTVGQVTFFDEDGRVLPFLPAEGGGFSSPQDLNATLSQNADGSFGLTYLSGETWSFTSAGQLASRSLEGQTVTLTYAANGQLLQASHSLGLHLTLSYGSCGRLTQVESSDGRTVSFGQSADGTLTSVTEPGGGVAQYAFTTAGPFPQVSSITSADGNVLVTNAYDATSQQVTSQSFPTGGGAEFSYGDTGLTTVTSTPSAATVTFQADANGRMTRATDPFGNAATFTYDANGRLTVATTPGGSQLAQSYDASGNVLTSSFGGATGTWIYDSAATATTRSSGTAPPNSWPAAADRG
jgi:YD repeat-containing protein